MTITQRMVLLRHAEKRSQLINKLAEDRKRHMPVKQTLRELGRETCTVLKFELKAEKVR